LREFFIHSSLDNKITEDTLDWLMSSGWESGKVDWGRSEHTTLFSNEFANDDPVFQKCGSRVRKDKPNSDLEKPLGAQGRDRTTDTAIFSRMLYQLSYLGAAPAQGPASAGL
jgi:hypothetical protein